MRDFPREDAHWWGRGDRETEGSRSCWKHPRGAGAHCVSKDTLGQGRSLHELTHGETRISGPWFGLDSQGEPWVAKSLNL